MSTPNSFLSVSRESLVAFDHAVAGHDGLLCEPSGWFITKPCTPEEIAFYESSVQHPGVMQFMPRMLGQLQLQGQQQQQQQQQQKQDANTATAIDPSDTPAVAQAPTTFNSSDTSAIKQISRSVTGETVEDIAVGGGANTGIANTDQDWTPKHGTKIRTDLAIVLENIASGFKRPSVLDIKLGKRLWADDAPLPKRRRLDEVSQATTSGSLGFRIAGMKVWVGEKGNRVGTHDEKKEEGKSTGLGEDNKTIRKTKEQSKTNVVEVDGYKRFDRWYGRSFTADNVIDGFETFFSSSKAGKNDHSKLLARRIATRLRDMQQALEAEESRWYSSSVLLIYEGDHEALEDALTHEEEDEKARKRKYSLLDEEEDGDEEDDGFPPGSFQVVGALPGSEAANHTQAITLPDTATNLDLQNLNSVPQTTGSISTTPTPQNLRLDTPAATPVSTSTNPVPTTTMTLNLDDIGLDDDEEDDNEPPKVLEARLIDFAHADWTPGQGPDENVLFGLRSAAGLFERIARGGCDS